jgi:hypothetical protein
LPPAYFVALTLGAYLTLVELVKHHVMRQLRLGAAPEQEQPLLPRRGDGAS